MRTGVQLFTASPGCPGQGRHTARAPQRLLGGEQQNLGGSSGTIIYLLELRAARACGEEEGKWGAVGCRVLLQDPDFLTTHCPPPATGGASEGEEPRRAARPGLLTAEVSAAATSFLDRRGPAGGEEPGVFKPWPDPQTPPPHGLEARLGGHSHMKGLTVLWMCLCCLRPEDVANVFPQSGQAWARAPTCWERMCRCRLLGSVNTWGHRHRRVTPHLLLAPLRAWVWPWDGGLPGCSAPALSLARRVSAAVVTPCTAFSEPSGLP